MTLTPAEIAALSAAKGELAKPQYSKHLEREGQ